MISVRRAHPIAGLALLVAEMLLNKLPKVRGCGLGLKGYVFIKNDD